MSEGGGSLSLLSLSSLSRLSSSSRRSSSSHPRCCVPVLVVVVLVVTFDIVVSSILVSSSSLHPRCCVPVLVVIVLVVTFDIVVSSILVSSSSRPGQTCELPSWRAVCVGPCLRWICVWFAWYGPWSMMLLLIMRMVHAMVPPRPNRARIAPNKEGPFGPCVETRDRRGTIWS